MDFKKYKTEVKQLGVMNWEIIVITEDNIKHGLIIQTLQKPDRNGVLQFFKENYKHFFIELEVIDIF